jgi:MinD-like ATPase involved in chromosome partitioning or flagellar assembly
MKIAFHSYKGGVGRTKVMLGAAALLAMRGYRVGMLDFDLDASGLATSLNADRNQVGKRELLYILHRADPSKVLEAMIDVTDFVASRFGHKPQDPGCLKYIPTISDPALADEIKFNASTRYSVHAILEEILQECGVDHLLIDLKPGYSPSSSLIMPFVNHAVVVTRLDRQNIEGLRTIVPQMHRKHLDPIVVVNYLFDDPLVEDRIHLLEQAVDHRVDVRIQFDPRLLFDDDIVSVAKDGSAMNIALNALVGLLEKRLSDKRLSEKREQPYVELA